MPETTNYSELASLLGDGGIEKYLSVVSDLSEDEWVMNWAWTNGQRTTFEIVNVSLRWSEIDSDHLFSIKDFFQHEGDDVDMLS